MKNCTSLSVSLPDCAKSISRPGVPLTMSMPALHAFICAPASTPPTKSAARRGGSEKKRAKPTTHSCTCARAAT
eukprot:1606625-Prymnesium_polylepis.1